MGKVPGLNLPGNPTITDLLDFAVEVAQIALQTLSVGRKSTDNYSWKFLPSSPIMGALYYYRAQLMVAHTHLLFWTETNGSETGRMMLSLVKEYSGGLALCLTLVEFASIVNSLTILAEESLL
jgi:hypothetical protein